MLTCALIFEYLLSHTCCLGFATMNGDCIVKNDVEDIEDIIRGDNGIDEISRDNRNGVIVRSKGLKNGQALEESIKLDSFIPGKLHGM